MHVWPLPHRPVQLGWTCQECETPTDVALGVIEARKSSHHFTVHAPADGLTTPFSHYSYNRTFITYCTVIVNIITLSLLSLRFTVTIITHPGLAEDIVALETGQDLLFNGVHPAVTVL